MASYTLAFREYGYHVILHSEWEDTHPPTPRDLYGEKFLRGKHGGSLDTNGHLGGQKGISAGGGCALPCGAWKAKV